MGNKMSVKRSVVVLAASLFAWVNCASDRTCASMRSWFPGTNPLTFADNLPYKLSVTGGAYYPSSKHTVYLNGSITNEIKMRGFVGFIIYAENSVPEYANGYFVTENLPPGFEVVNCSNLLIVQNSTNVGNWTSVKLLWKAPKDGHLAGNITFRASVVEQTSPQILYYEGFRAHLGYQCPMVKCVLCFSNIYLSDSYGCQGCKCGGFCDGRDSKKGRGLRCPRGIFPPYDICANTTCPFNGICQPSGDGKRAECNCNIFCPAVYQPLCGTDGETHGNECEMKVRACQKQKEIKKDYYGKCNDICANTTCPFSGICQPSGDGKRAECNCNIFCPAVYQPLCGTDGETHGNECEMKVRACQTQKEIKKNYYGECNDICANTTCPFNGTCQPSGDGKRVECSCDMIVCAAVYRPVCGTDGETHGNECAMRIRACQKQKEIKKDYDGECNDICANTTCQFNGICQPSGDRKRAECKCNINCAEIYRPVCGTDGETHSNECKMKARACEKQKEIKKDYDGECIVAGAAGNFTFSTLMMMMINVLAFLWFFVLGDLYN